jgi:hypothetical protein
MPTPVCGPSTQVSARASRARDDNRRHHRVRTRLFAGGRRIRTISNRVTRPSFLQPRARTRGTESSQTRRWREMDSNSRSHRERSGHGRAPRTNHRHRARAHLIVPASLFDSTWDREFESPLLQRGVSSEPCCGVDVLLSFLSFLCIRRARPHRRHPQRVNHSTLFWSDTQRPRRYRQESSRSPRRAR